VLAVLILDSAEESLLVALARSGRMPALADLMERGRTVALQSDAHVLDGSVFQTLLTGVNPGEHGIYKYRQIVPGTYCYRRSRAEESPMPQVWTVLSRQGMSCCVFDVPKAFPAEGFRGAMATCWGAYTPAAAPVGVPKGLRTDIVRRFGPHPQPEQEPLPLATARYAAARDRLVAAAGLRAEICMDLLSRERHDFFATAFSEPHVAAHQFWHLRDPAHPMYDARAASLCSRAMEDVYEAVDRAVGSILKSLPQDATVLVMTQQGVESNFSGSHLLPAWLARRRGEADGRPVRGPVPRAASRLSAAWRGRLQRVLPAWVQDRWVDAKYRPHGDVFLLPGSEFMALLRVNLRGREPAGTVAAERCGETLQALREDLLRVRNTRTGRPAAAEVLFLRDVYRGRCAGNLPDAVVRWANDAPVETLDCPRWGLVTEGLRFMDVTHSCHTGRGLAVAAGPAVPPGAATGVHRLEDVTATFYALAGAKPPAHLEGRPIGLTGARAPAENPRG
jgi:predicted AlkP superfamily phosphohydrolase/phosphomutase